MGVISRINKAVLGKQPQIDSHSTSSGAAPSDLPNLQLWLRGDSFTFDTTATWADLSGNGRDFTQTGSNRPTVDGTGLNGQATVDFVRASSQYLVGNGDTLFNTGAAHTVIMVVKNDAFGGAGQYQSPLNFKGNTAYVMWFTNDAFYGDCAFGFMASKIMSATASWGTTDYNLFVQTYNGSGDTTPANYTLEKNGASQTVGGPKATGAGTAANNIGRLAGGSDYFDGKIAEIIVMSSVISASDLAELETYINERYGITI
jgi:hypothetical protein